MSFADDLELAKTYPILALVLEAQNGLGYTTGLVNPDYDRDQKTRCPVHADRSPSAKAYVKSNSVYCWVCGKTWDAPALHAISEGLSLPAAVRSLLARMGVQATVLTDDELLALADQIDRPASREPSREQVDAWLDGLWHWCHANAPVASHLDVVLDEIQLARRLDPPLAVSVVRAALAWARRLDELRQTPPYPSPPGESDVSLYLTGLAGAS